MIEVNGIKYEPVAGLAATISCAGCAFDKDMECHEAQSQFDCCPTPDNGSKWYIFKEVKKDGTGT